MDKLLNKLQTTLFDLRREYRELRRHRDPETERVKKMIFETEEKFEEILLADIQNITSNQELYSKMTKLVGEAQGAVEIIADYQNKIAGIAKVLSKIGTVIKTASEVLNLT